MKTPITFLMTVAGCLLSFLSLNAAVITVSNNPQIPAQYSDAQLAYNAAVDGDVLYLHGSAVSYTLYMGWQSDNVGGTVTSKKVKVVGPGFNPTGQNNLRAIINLFIFPSSETSMDNISIEGIEIQQVGIYNADLNSIGNFAVNNLQFTRCLISGSGVNYNYDPIAQNLIPSVIFIQSFLQAALPSQGATVLNCIVKSLNATNAYIKNCTFFQPVNNCSNNSPSISGSVIENCIFKSRTPDCYPEGQVFGSASNVYNNCLFDFVLAGSGFGNSDGFNNCLFATATNLTDETFTDVSTIPLFMNELDLRPAAGSAALTAGPGSTVIGITGGTFPFTNPKLQSRTTLPQMNTLSIGSTSVQQNGSISISFQAAKQD